MSKEGDDLLARHFSALWDLQLESEGMTVSRV